MTSPDHLLAPVVLNLAILRKNVSRQASTQLSSMCGEWKTEDMVTKKKCASNEHVGICELKLP